MSEYCKDCSEKLFGEDFKELTDSTIGPDDEIYVLCEGCGFIVVNRDGKKIRNQEGTYEEKMKRFIGQ